MDKVGGEQGDLTGSVGLFCVRHDKANGDSLLPLGRGSW